MHKIIENILALLLVVVPFKAMGQLEVIHGNCTPDLNGSMPAAVQGMGAVKHKMPAINTNWDPTRTYHQMVILIEFSDLEFSRVDAKAAYDSILNMSGYNEGSGPSCMADYFRTQSGGLLNLQFDIFGPVKVSKSARPSTQKNYGQEAIHEATKMVVDQNPDYDYSVFDWDGDGYVNQVIVVTAGFCGNSGGGADGYLWPNTSTISTVETPDGYKIRNYSASAERWPTSSVVSCGIGTICHEYSHSLGLPDIYPVNGWTYTAADEWDLMDGGNIINQGWCPSNYTALEKMLMGWMTPIELTEPTTIEDLKPVEEGGAAFIIRHTDNEYLMLENRQWRGWDLGVPGKGLVIYHVNYDDFRWRNNTVNNVANKLNFSLIHADNMDYDDWKNYCSAMRLEHYRRSVWLNSRYLSTSPYPWTTDSTSTVLDSLTINSVPAPVMYNKNDSDEVILSKAITNIRMSEDGLISFDFMGGDPNGIRTATWSEEQVPAVFDLSGRRVRQTGRGLLLKRDSKGKIRKIFQ